MGLAEHSPYNPLKVIHSELEYDQNENEKQIAFVGISNWILDAAKMNRGITISIPEPNEDDIKKTAFTIASSYDEKITIKYKTFLDNLGLSYYNFKKYMFKKFGLVGKDEFHGNRDFYHLVKNTARNILEKVKNNSLNEETLLECAINSIERNFSGIKFDGEEKLTTSTIIYKKIFHDIYPNCLVKNEYNVFERIKENINDLNSRYLLISSENSIGTFLLASILENDKNNFNFYIGSPFIEDLHSEKYAAKVLNKIQSHMERGDILILKNLETVYPSMYDLFNQNFTVIGNKNYSRLALGSDTNTFAQVHKNFRCIVNVDISKLEQEEAPFLNRFEKHIMSFEYLLDEELNKEAETIKKNIDSFFECDTKKFQAIDYDLKELKINCSIDEIQALVYNFHKNGKKREEMNDLILEKIALTLPQDILLNLRISGPIQSSNFQKVLNFYKKGVHENILKFLEQTESQKNIVYTFSNYLDNIFENTDEVNNKKAGIIKQENVNIIKVNSLRSEREFETQIDKYLDNNKLKVCFIQLLPYEGSFMDYLKYFIENKIKKKASYKIKKKASYENKIFIFIVYMSRILLEEKHEIDKMTLKEIEEFNKKILKYTLSNLSGFNQIFIDDLRGDSKYKFGEIITMNTKELLEIFVNPDEEFSKNIFKSISYMNYNVIAPYNSLSKENYVMKLIEFINNNKRIRDAMNEAVFNQSFEEGVDTISKIFEDKDSLIGDKINIISKIKNYVSKVYLSNLTLILFKAERDQLFSTLLTNDEKKLRLIKEDKKNDKDGKINLKKEDINEDEDETNIERLAEVYLEKIPYKDDEIKIIEKIGGNKVNILFGFNLPGIKPIFDKILKFVEEEISEKYRKNEKVFIDENDDEKLEKTKKEYFENLNKYNESLFKLIKDDADLGKIIYYFINSKKEEKEKKEKKEKKKY